MNLERLNDGSGDFGFSAHNTFGRGNSRSVTLGDVDGDSDLDAVVAKWSEPQEVWLNNAPQTYLPLIFRS
jgi:hypothetical protein